MTDSLLGFLMDPWGSCHSLPAPVSGVLLFPVGVEAAVLSRGMCAAHYWSYHLQTTGTSAVTSS